MISASVQYQPVPRLATVGSLEQRNWYAAYTRSRHEKTVVDSLMHKSVRCFLPLYRTVHQWKNRQAEVQLPLFPGYVFVGVGQEEMLQVLRTPGVVRLVGFRGRPTPIPQAEIDAIRTAVLSGVETGPHKYLAVGERVEIKSGPLQGLEGILLRKNGGLRVILSVGLITRSISVEVNSCDVQRASPG